MYTLSCNIVFICIYIYIYIYIYLLDYYGAIYVLYFIKYYCYKQGYLYGSEKDADTDGDTDVAVVVVPAASVGVDAVQLPEDDDQVGRRLQVRLTPRGLATRTAANVRTAVRVTTSMFI